MHHELAEVLIQDQTVSLLKAVGLEDVKREKAGSLPYGQQRRLEIARRWQQPQGCCFSTNPQRA